MRKHSLRLLSCLLLLLLAHLAVPSGARGQEVRFYPPYELYKFHMNGTNGYFYTPWYSQGVNAGYTYRGQIGSGINGTGGVYPVPDGGYMPDASTGLIPLYQWTVFQGARSYTYFSPVYSNLGGGYYFNGVMGYVYPSNVTTDQFGAFNATMAAWYSPSKGYWYGIGKPGEAIYEYPPDGTYYYQGVVCRVPFPPTAATGPNRCNNPPSGGPINCNGQRAVQYNPPPPPPSCDPYEEQSCYNWSGWWDSSTCTCAY